MEFVDRDREVEALRSRYESGDPELVVVYGRRRVGKSELVRHSLAGREDAVYYQARETSPKLQVRRFIETAAEVAPEISRVREEWEPVLDHLGEDRRIIVVDEFPYLVEADASVPSTFQRAWDLHLSETACTLVLVGSALSVMEEKVLAGSSPLYGRRTMSLDLAPLTLGEARPLLPSDWDAPSLVRAWSVFGGMPHYLRAIDRSRSLLENVQDVILSAQGLLHDEPEFLLRQELAKPATYMAILEALAAGATGQNEIAQAAGVDHANVGTYLQRLRRLRVVTREVPVTEDPARSKRGRYTIADPFLAFWFRFVHGRRSRIQLLDENAADHVVAPELNDHAASTYEDLCTQALPQLHPGDYTQIGRWWHREHEVDVVGLTAGPRLVLGECKFTSAPVDAALLDGLEDTADEVRWSPPDGSDPEPHYIIFSRSGFTSGLQEQADDRDDVNLHTVEDVVGALVDGA